MEKDIEPSSRPKVVYEYTIYLRGKESLGDAIIQVLIKRFGKHVSYYGQWTFSRTTIPRATVLAFLKLTARPRMQITNVRFVTDSDYLGLVANYLCKHDKFKTKPNNDLFDYVRTEVNQKGRKLQFVKASPEDMLSIITHGRDEWAKPKRWTKSAPISQTEFGEKL